MKIELTQDLVIISRKVNSSDVIVPASGPQENRAKLTVPYLNFGERFPRRLCRWVSEQDTKEVLDGIGFLDGSAARSFNFAARTFLCIGSDNSPQNPEMA